MNKTFKTFITCGCAFLLILSGCSKSDDEVKPSEEVVETLVANNVYASPTNPTNEQILAFNALSEAISNQADGEELAKQVTINFAFDFFSLKNKTGQDDIGGLTYLPNDRVEEFKTYAVAHYYQNYSGVVKDYGVESLPSVKTVTINSTTKQDVSYLDVVYEGYVVDATIEYQKTKLDETTLKTNIKATMIFDDGIIGLIGIE